MGQQLSPPLLGGTIPAFYSNDEGIVITIPFSMNRVVSLTQVSGFEIKIKTVQSGNQLVTMQVNKKLNQDNEVQIIIPKLIENKWEEKYTKLLEQLNYEIALINQKYLNGEYRSETEYQDTIDIIKKEYSDSINSLIKDDYINNPDYSKFKIGQYYKVQIAYINNGTVGYYSSVAVAKYTTKPNIVINALNEKNLNSHSYSYTGVYSQENGDMTERVYSYRFNLYNAENILVSTSGDLLHDTTKDVELGKSEDEYVFAQDLPIGQTHRVEYIVTTTNGLTVSSPRYRVTQKQSISPELNATLHASLNYDNGYIDINLKTKSIEELASGFFIVVRACDDSDYTVWEEIHRFSLMAQIATRHLCRDFTIEQGKNYIYGVQQYNSNNLYSNRILSNMVYADFEDAFLFDGKRQLKIKYNPKISSFKKDLLETKTDTIGGKHPFIFRNGRVYYSEFPISGLISYQMDEENLFLSEEDYGLVEKTTNLTGDNIAAERTFKMKVLEWLTNGEPKVFRSPTEGNFIVRLMNSSLSPNDTVGRMLHTFSSTAYEIADFNYATLGDMGFITVEKQQIQSLQWETVEFAPRGENGVIELVEPNTNLLKYVARTLRFDNMVPGDIISINFENGSNEDIKIGVTGSYYIDTGVAITGVQLKASSTGSMTYSYDYVKEPTFNNISDVSVIEMPQHQFIGEHDILTELLYVWDQNAINKDGEQGDWIKNPKLELIDLYKIDVEKRPLQRVSINNVLNNESDPFLIYEVGTYVTDENSGPRPGYPQTTFTRDHYYDAFNSKRYDGDEEIYEPYILLDGNLISVNEIEETTYLKPGKLTELKSGNGVLVNLSYQMGVIKYNLEDDALLAYNNGNGYKGHYLYNLGKAIIDYNDAVIALNISIGLDENGNYIDNKDPADEVIAAARKNVTETYTRYILELVRAQEEDARRKGEIV